MDNKCTLDMLPLNESAVVEYIDCNEKLKNRLFDFGIIENSIITPVFNSPFSDPRAYLIKNSVIALRNNDSKKITVSPIK